MNERELRAKIEDDLRLAAEGRGRVLYLEGKSDAPILLGLLGAREVTSMAGAVLYDGILIRGLPASKDSGSGSSAVAQRLEVAQRFKLDGIRGVLDGDGEPLATLAAEFDAPHRGPRFRWKTYCIENLLARACWPEQWGPVPAWREVMTSFAPYVAINRLGLELRSRLHTLGLARGLYPNRARPLSTADELLARLREGKELLAELDVEAMFLAELNHFSASLDRSLDEAHALLNGKWLVEVYAPGRTGLTQEQCREQWAAYLAESGGDPEIKAWWDRTVAA